ncbi:hypothetical protein OIDMADRAFT_139501 [Oidiodendron maius Zn]|uniref:Uncharacterized protein n=1 Tax=Oidiodendron maius (strain Zn) TaxID=913774 RepID=A0A0C3CS84_OIDMZ|nr:hypothetical protein OIDMADRAFT_139501 [Oidiodendron maius Zn]
MQPEGVRGTATAKNADSRAPRQRKFVLDIRPWIPIAQLYDASKVGDDKDIQRLLNLGVNSDINGWTPLHDAAVNGHKTVVKLLMRQDGINLDLVDNRGKTALAWAEKYGHADIVHIISN